MRMKTIVVAVIIVTAAFWPATSSAADAPSPVETSGVGGVRVPKDFKLDMVYLVPRKTQGSWVAMCFEPKGRLIVSDQNGSLHRVTLPQAEGGEAKTEKIELDVGGAHG